jgi:Protein of unknown function (DUF2924)
MRGHSTNPAAIEAEIAHLRSLALDALRRHWRVIFGRTPPADLSKDLLGRMIAYRLQERAFGGLDRESLRFLDGLARHGGSPRRRLKPGTVLVRDYQGQRHTVTVVSDGFDWQGATYPSLSAIARAITGTAWSGPRFFALARGNGARFVERRPGHTLSWCGAELSCLTCCHIRIKLAATSTTDRVTERKVRRLLAKGGGILRVCEGAKAQPCPLTVRAHHGARPCWRKSTR